MNEHPTSIVVLGTDSAFGDQWLHRQLSGASYPRPEGHHVLAYPADELDAVVWSEALRWDAQRAGVRVSIGVAERLPGAALRDTVAEAIRAFEHARALGGGMTLACSVLLRAA